MKYLPLQTRRHTTPHVVQRGVRSYLRMGSAERAEQIRFQLRAGVTRASVIAKHCGCTEELVRLYLKQMWSEVVRIRVLPEQRGQRTGRGHYEFYLTGPEKELPL